MQPPDKEAALSHDCPLCVIVFVFEFVFFVVFVFSLLVSQVQSPDKQAALSHDGKLSAIPNKDLEPGVVLRHRSHAHLGKGEETLFLKQSVIHVVINSHNWSVGQSSDGARSFSQF